jgi:hypothetical protein
MGAQGASRKSQLTDKQKKSGIEMCSTFIPTRMGMLLGFSDADKPMKLIYLARLTVKNKLVDFH